jgi:ArsR family transcriptional regulator
MQNLLRIFKALSEETRLRILKLLEHGELCVCDLVAALDIVQPKVSFHLNALKGAGFIKDRKEGRWSHYRLDEADVFRRFLILSVLEKVEPETVAEDRKRLQAFLQSKTTGMEKVIILKDKCAGCGE